MKTTKSLVGSITVLFLLLTINDGAICQSTVNIIWTGGFETGDFMQWPNKEGDAPNFTAVPAYGVPEMYGGDGSCLCLETKIVRDGKFAAKFTTKNSVNGTEPSDCKGLPDCGRRKVEVKGWFALTSRDSAIMPDMSERWMSVSHFVPENWDDKGDGWGPTVFQNKPYINNSKVSPTFAIALESQGWKIHHRWTDEKWLDGQLPWQKQMFYTGTYPKLGVVPKWDDGVKDFPDPEVSRAALSSINKGGWTDWIIHVKWDARGAKDGGTGFLELFKREDDGPWLKILDIRPGHIERGGMEFDRGIGYYEPKRDGEYEHWTHWGGFSINVGQYQHKDRVWYLPDNRTIIIDNIKIGNENATLEEMAPDLKTTGINTRKKNNNNFELYPNPAKNKTFNLKWNKKYNVESIFVFDSKGVEIPVEIVFFGNHANIVVNKKVIPGVYFCKVCAESCTKSFIVHL